MSRIDRKVVEALHWYVFYLIHSFPIHPFSTPWQRKGTLGTNGLSCPYKINLEEFNLGFHNNFQVIHLWPTPSNLNGLIFQMACKYIDISIFSKSMTKIQWHSDGLWCHRANFKLQWIIFIIDLHFLRLDKCGILADIGNNFHITICSKSEA